MAWALADHQNSVRDLVEYDEGGTPTLDDDSVSVEKHVVYDAFGNVTSDTAPGVTCLILFTGRLWDADTGLQNNLNRWYDPAVGRWLSTDPIGFNGDPGNLYRYCNNSPGNWVDPTGLEACWTISTTKGLKVYTGTTGPELLATLKELEKKDLVIRKLIIKGHGASEGLVTDSLIAQLRGLPSHYIIQTPAESPLIRIPTGKTGGQGQYEDVSDLFQAVTDSNTYISLRGCNTAGSAERVSKVLPEVKAGGSCWPALNIPFTWWCVSHSWVLFRNGHIISSPGDCDQTLPGRPLGGGIHGA